MEINEVKINGIDFDKLIKEHAFKFYQLINENVREYINDKPFITKRLKISHYFIDDCISGIERLKQKVLKLNLMTFDSFLKKVPNYTFICNLASKYEESLTNKQNIQVCCSIVFKEDKDKQNYFGITYDLTDKVVVVIYEFNEFFKYLSHEENGNKSLLEINTIDYLNDMKERLKTDCNHNHKYVHEFQHVMQILHNTCNKDKYDLEGDSEKSFGYDIEDYYDSTTEKEAFFISYLFNIVDEKVDLNNYELVKNKFIELMKADTIDPKYFVIFEKSLKQFLNLKESTGEVQFIKQLKNFYKDKTDYLIDRAKQINKLSKINKRQLFNDMLTKGVAE